jgi:hypothetical protein
MHIMYVDESGDCGYPASGQFPKTGGPTRYYVRCGFVLHGWKWMTVDKMVSDFKRSRGLTWNSEIKATHLRRGKGASSGWSAYDRREFLNDLLDSIAREIDVNLLVAAIDKQKIDQGQRERFTNPSVRSLELLLERYNAFLTSQKDKAGITILDAAEAKSDENLRYFQSYLLNFSDHLDPRRVVEVTLFMPSHTSNLLQLADVCANVIFRKFAREDGNAGEYRRLSPRIMAEKIWP